MSETRFDPGANRYLTSSAHPRWAVTFSPKHELFANVWMCVAPRLLVSYVGSCEVRPLVGRSFAYESLMASVDYRMLFVLNCMGIRLAPACACSMVELCSLLVCLVGAFEEIHCA
jgi:hypothetical protein